MEENQQNDNKVEEQSNLSSPQYLGPQPSQIIPADTPAQNGNEIKDVFSSKPIDKAVYYRTRLLISILLLIVSFYLFFNYSNWADSSSAFLPLLLLLLMGATFVFGLVYFLQSISGLIIKKSNKSSTKLIVIMCVLIIAVVLVYSYWQYSLNS